MPTRSLPLAIALLTASMGVTAHDGAPHADTVMLRGRPQAVRVYGRRGDRPVVVSSGDGGWMHLAPHLAETLAAHGFFVVGFDVRAYLTSFTAGKSALRSEDEPADYRALIEFARAGSLQRPILIGVSEGAGLSALAATEPQTQALIDGVIGIGMPDLTELGWRWSDALIYLTHGVPDEPTFSVAAIAIASARCPWRRSNRHTTNSWRSTPSNA